MQSSRRLPPKESEQEDTAPVPEHGVTLNTDLLGEYKMTYAELTAKHGRMTGARGFACGPDIPYSFETGYGYYWFKTPEEDVKDIVKCTDPEYGFGFRYVPGKTETYLCRGIYGISPDKMFIGDYETLSIEEISKIEGLHYKETGTDNRMTGSKLYASSFTYDGWHNDDVIIFIFHDDKDMIDLTSECRFWIHPMDIDKEEGRSE